MSTGFFQGGAHFTHPRPTATSNPNLTRLREAQAQAKFRGVSPSLLRLACTDTAPDTQDSHSEFTRDNTAAKVAWRSHLENLSVALAYDLVDLLFDGMAQPERDTYSLKQAHEKVARVYKQDWSSWKGDLPYAHKGPFEATVRPFKMFYPEAGDPVRLKEGWAKGFPVVPVPLGLKGGSGGPLWKHLEDGAPTKGLREDGKYVDDWRDWEKPKFRNGNTAMLWGHGAPGRNTHRLYDLEVEYREIFDALEARDYFLSFTPCYLSAKSVHIILMSDEIVQGRKAKGFEFRGHGNYSLIPGSEHPSSTPAAPVMYRPYNPGVETILQVSNIRAFVHHYFPILFTKEFPPDPDALQATPTADAAEVSLQDQSRRARLQRREEKLYGGRNFVVKAQALAGLDRAPDFGVRSEKVPYTKVGVLFGPEAARLSETALEDLLTRGAWSKQADRVQECGSPMHGFCWQDGDFPEYKTISACANICHTCMTETARRIGADLLLPDLARGRRYRVVRMIRLVPLSGQDEGEIQAEFQNEYNGIADIVARLASRQRFKKVVLGRSLSFYLARPMSALHLSLVLLESAEDAGAGQAFLDELLATCLELRIWGEMAFQKGDDLSIQLMEMTFCHLMGMADTTDSELFAAFFAFSKGRHLFQALGSLFKIVANLQRREPLLCPVCQRPLRWRVDTPKELQAAPTPSPPPPKQARLVV